MDPVIVALIEALGPVVIEWAKYQLSQGKDPKEQLQIMLDAADGAADTAELLKFGPKP